MKKQNFIMVFALVAFGFMACNNKIENGLQKTIDEDEAVQFLRMMTIQERLDMDRELSVTTNYFHLHDVEQYSEFTTRNSSNNAYLFRFDGFGRLAKGSGSKKCGGIGFCDVRWNFLTAVVDFDEYGSILERDPITGQFYIDVLLAEPVPNHITKESFNFHMDDYLLVNTMEVVGNDFALQKGVFPLNPDLGVAGGYRIPVVIVE